MNPVPRRILGLGFLASFLTYAFPVFAAVRPTVACRYVGQKTTFAGRLFTCVKVSNKGKTKLQWDSGKPLPKPSPSQTSTSTLSPAPTPTPTSAPTAISKIDIPLGKSSEVPENGSNIFMATNRYGTTSGYIVVRNSGELVAMSDVCTHNGCSVKIHKDGFLCPCHNALFDSKNGAVLRGPAAHPLNRLPVFESNGVIYITD